MANALQGKVLPRSAAAIEATITDWFVAAAGDEILGCVSLLRYTSGLVEVRSLVVGERYRGLRIGSQLMEALLLEARRRKVPTLFALTRKVGFFERFGFKISERARFPEKVWHDCRLCPLIDNCDETAMVLELVAGG
jgi:amino-acid N-acetyltransferase